MSTFSLLVVTRDGAPRLDAVLGQAKDYYPDQIVVVINDKTIDNSEEIARYYTDDVYLMDFGSDMIEAVLNEAYALCTSDWIFRLDDDEIISESFFPEVHNKIDQDEIDHYWFPRFYNVGDLEHFINATPWHPDRQMRLFRKSKLIPHSGAQDDATKINGPSEYWSDCHIFHLKWLQFTRKERELQWSQRPSKGINDFFKPFTLYEDFEAKWKGKIEQCWEKPL